MENKILGNPLLQMIDQGNLKLLGGWYNKFVLITENLFSTELRNP